MSYVYDTGWTWYDPGRPHPFTTSTGSEGHCETCGSVYYNAHLHRGPFGPSLPIFSRTSLATQDSIDPVGKPHLFQPSDNHRFCDICGLSYSDDMHTPVLDSRSRTSYTDPMPTETKTAQQAFEDAIDALSAVISDTENIIAPQHIAKMRKAFHAMQMVQQYGMEPAR